MKILIDTTSLTKGGGQKVGWNFVNEILDHPREEHSFFFFCAQGSKIHDFLLERGAENVYAAPSSTGKRILWQVTQASRLLKEIRPDVIYIMFGACLYPRRYCQVCGEAASKLFFPEIDFWCEFPLWKKILKKWKDQDRILTLKRAHGVIFENESMFMRCRELYPAVFERSCFIKPAINKQEGAGDPAALSPQEEKHVPSVLMLCSWHQNKNYATMPAYRLIRNNAIPPILSGHLKRFWRIRMGIQIIRSSFLTPFRLIRSLPVHWSLQGTGCKS